MCVLLGEVLHRGAVAFLRKHAHVHLNPFEAELHASFIFAFGEHFAYFRVLHEAIENGLRLRVADKQIEVADGFLAAAERTGRFHRVVTQVFLQFVGNAHREP